MLLGLSAMQTMEWQEKPVWAIFLQLSPSSLQLPVFNIWTLLLPIWEQSWCRTAGQCDADKTGDLTSWQIEIPADCYYRGEQYQKGKHTNEPIMLKESQILDNEVTSSPLWLTEHWSVTTKFALHCHHQLSRTNTNENCATRTYGHGVIVCTMFYGVLAEAVSRI